MKIHPNFLKPILPGFQNGTKIPSSFFNNHLLRKHGKARLRRGGREWKVKINENGFIAEGWSRFATENGLEVGDVVNLQLVGKMSFEASVFDGISLCGKEKKEEDAQEVDSIAEVPAYRCFIGRIKNYNIQLSSFCLPVNFVRRNGLWEKSEIVLTYKGGRRRVNVRLNKLEAGKRFRINYGLHKIFKDVGVQVKQGDKFKFELIEAGDLPVARLSLVSSL